MSNDESVDIVEVGTETSLSSAAAETHSASARTDADPEARYGAGWHDPWGANPADNAPESHGTFNPLYICLLHIGFDPDWRLKINHASYRYRGEQTPTKRLEKALGIFTDKILGSYEFGDQSMQDLGHVSYIWQYPGHQPGRTRDSTGFADFKFRSPTEIFIFLESQTVYVGPKERLFACTKYGHSRPTTQMDKNYSFYGADIVPDADLGQLQGSGRLIRVQNYAKLVNGDSTDTADQYYALNIHLKVPGGPAGLIPIIIDPDTGNGTGNEP